MKPRHTGFKAIAILLCYALVLSSYPQALLADPPNRGQQNQPNANQRATQVLQELVNQGIDDSTMRSLVQDTIRARQQLNRQTEQRDSGVPITPGTGTENETDDLWDSYLTNWLTDIWNDPNYRFLVGSVLVAELVWIYAVPARINQALGGIASRLNPFSRLSPQLSRSVATEATAVANAQRGMESSFLRHLSENGTARAPQNFQRYMERLGPVLSEQMQNRLNQTATAQALEGMSEAERAAFANAQTRGQAYAQYLNAYEGYRSALLTQLSQPATERSLIQAIMRSKNVSQVAAAAEVTELKNFLRINSLESLGVGSRQLRSQMLLNEFVVRAGGRTMTAAEFSRTMQRMERHASEVDDLLRTGGRRASRVKIGKLVGIITFIAIPLIIYGIARYGRMQAEREAERRNEISLLRFNADAINLLNGTANVELTYAAILNVWNSEGSPVRGIQCPLWPSGDRMPGPNARNPHLDAFRGLVWMAAIAHARENSLRQANRESNEGQRQREEGAQRNGSRVRYYQHLYEAIFLYGRSRLTAPAIRNRLLNIRTTHPPRNQNQQNVDPGNRTSTQRPMILSEVIEFLAQRTANMPQRILQGIATAQRNQGNGGNGNTRPGQGNGSGGNTGGNGRPGFGNPGGNQTTTSQADQTVAAANNGHFVPQSELAAALRQIVVLTVDDDSDRAYGNFYDVGKQIPMIARVQERLNRINNIKSIGYDIAFVGPAAQAQATATAQRQAQTWAQSLIDKLNESPNPVVLGAPPTSGLHDYLRNTILRNVENDNNPIRLGSVHVTDGNDRVKIVTNTARRSIDQQRGWMNPLTRVSHLPYFQTSAQHRTLSFEMMRGAHERYTSRIQQIILKDFTEVGIRKMRVQDLLAAGNATDEIPVYDRTVGHRGGTNQLQNRVVERVQRRNLNTYLGNKYIIFGSDHSALDAFSNAQGQQFNGVFTHTLALAMLVKYKIANSNPPKNVVTLGTRPQRPQTPPNMPPASP